MVSEQQVPDEQYIGVRRCSDSSSSWQAYIPAVPTSNGSEYAFESPPLPTAAAAAQQYDRLVVALLGIKYAVAGRNLNFSAEDCSIEDAKAAAQLLYVGNPHVLLDKQFTPAAARPAAAAPAVAAAVGGKGTAAKQPHKRRLHFDSDMSEGDWYDSAVAAAAGAAIAARRAAAAAAREAAHSRQQQKQAKQQQQQLLQEEEEEDIMQLAISQQLARTVSLNPPEAAAAAAGANSIIPSPMTTPITPAAAAAEADDDEEDEDEQLPAFRGSAPNITSGLSPGISWLHSLLLCRFLFQPCDHCSGKRMERPSAGRDKLIRFFNPADPARGYCNYCPELPNLSGSLLSVGRIQHSSPHQYFVKMADIIKASSSSSGGAGSSSSSVGVQVEDVSGIQTYPLSNGRVLFLKPRKQPLQQRQRQYKKGGWCVVDGRHLKDPNCQFCSIMCKLKAVENGGLNPELSAQQQTPAAEASPQEGGELSDQQRDLSIEPGAEAAMAAAAAAAAAAIAAVDGDDENDGEDSEQEHQRKRLKVGDVSQAAPSNSDVPVGNDLQQQQQQLDASMKDIGDMTQQQQQQEQPGAVAEGVEDAMEWQQQQQQQQGDPDLPSTAMQLVMPQGNPVLPIMSDVLGNCLVLNLPNAQPVAAAMEAAAAAAAEGLGPMAMLQLASQFFQ